MPGLEVAGVALIIANGHGRAAAAWHRYLPPVLMLALVWLAAAGGGPLLLRLRYERAGIAAGQWWRLATAHWVHLGAWHAMLDSAGLVLIWILYGAVLRGRGALAAIVASTLSIDAGLWWLSPRIEWYAGISGLLHGLWAAGALLALRARLPLAWMPAALLAGKLVHEALGGAAPAGQLMPVVPIAHVYGAAGGIAAGLALMLPFPARANRYNPPPAGQGQG